MPEHIPEIIAILILCASVIMLGVCGYLEIKGQDA